MQFLCLTDRNIYVSGAAACGDAAARHHLPDTDKACSVWAPDKHHHLLQHKPCVDVRSDPVVTAEEDAEAAAMLQHAEEPTGDHLPHFESFAKEERMTEALSLHHRHVEVGDLMSMPWDFVLRCTLQAAQLAALLLQP